MTSSTFSINWFHTIDCLMFSYIWYSIIQIEHRSWYQKSFISSSKEMKILEEGGINLNEWSSVTLAYRLMLIIFLLQYCCLWSLRMASTFFHSSSTLMYVSDNERYEHYPMMLLKDNRGTSGPTSDILTTYTHHHARCGSRHDKERHDYGYSFEIWTVW
jgi:hypothetical protein